ncbi:hypothetical protein D910_04208 [Dendroctonus ponderosae]|uniref:Cationic amino acid transporter C-terminal domain-containing protein n=1 Tax=Dendroctonus ponderosae TaxID=77166 RepID=U4U387_DENPD|nr:hypothetical protein D910_04208 [Dendroctonus ponderosae]
MRPVLLLTGVLLAVSAANDPHSITKRSFYLLFPKGAVLQFTYGLTVPFVLPRRSINLTWGFQAQFNLPSSLSNFYPTTIDVRSNSYWFDLPRVKFYQYLSKLLDNFGLNGEQCVLRSCCEVAEIPMYDREDSVLEKIVQYLFTPSIELSLNASSESVQEPEDALTKKLLQAEELGKSQGGCDDQYSNCIMSIVDLMTMSTRIFKLLTRRKTDAGDTVSEMARCLSLLDLSALGVGATLGLGVYVLAGSVAKTVAGPAVCLSFLAAAIASAFAGVCYAEFAARVPKAGSAYVYSYVTVGEFIAFVIGWNLILEYVIGTASVARGLSNYIDALATNRISVTFRAWLPMDVSFLSQYPDLLAFLLVLVLTGLLAFGVKESSMLNNIFTVLNLLTVGLVIVCGSIKADTNNWKLPAVEGYGTGGFMPYGVAGVMAGAAKCFYGFVGFDAVATTGEEAKNPQKDIPLAIVISLLIIFGAYFAVSTVLTLMLPYYDQNADAPFPYAFDQVGWTTVKWIVTSGAVFALCTSMLGAMFPLPRVIYAMAKDGIVFKPLGRVHRWTQTPLVATILSGIFSGFMAMIFDLNQLIDMMSIGTLLAYTIVAVCVLILRYQVDGDQVVKSLDTDEYPATFYSGFVDIFNLHNNKEANVRSSRIANWSVAIFSIFAALLAAIIIHVPTLIFSEPFYCVGFVISLVAMLALVVVIARQPVVDVHLTFKVPLVPFIPCLSVFFNLYLMLELDLHTWIRFLVWLIIGFLIYFCYGIRNSVEGRKRNSQQLQLEERKPDSYSPYNPDRCMRASGFYQQPHSADPKQKMRVPSWSQAHSALSRKKLILQSDDTKLAKVLTTLDLTALGVGSTLGVGVYVLAGEVAKTTAGPAVIVSFLIAALASVLAGLCYAEFGARVPKAGSAYVYSYVCIGEFFAFIIGWNLILEYLIGSASCLKALFLYFDNLANNSMSHYFQQTMPMMGGQVGTYADIFSLVLSIIFAVALAFGAKESSLVNNVFTLVNICIVLLVIVSGIFKSDPNNWSRTAQEAMGVGLGGFAPYGIKGIIKGAAKCFYGFIGFDCIATAGEEAKTPQKSIPIGVVMSLLIVFLAYFGMSTVLTMMLPYYEQDTTAPLPHVYDQIGWTTVKYVVSIGACCGLFSSLLGAMFPLPRIIYAMAADGLLFQALARVHPKFQTPFTGTLLAGAVTGILACIFELSKLTEMMSIGTLLAYSMVAACVLVLRYAPDAKKSDADDTVTLRSLFKRADTSYPTRATSAIVSWIIIIFFALCFVLSGLMTGFEDSLYRGELWLIGSSVAIGAVLVLLLYLVAQQPTSDVKLGFTVPLVPWIPGVSIFINIYLMTNINQDTWLKYVYWMAIGLVIYFTYGIWHSKERSPPLTAYCATPKTNGDSTYYGATAPVFAEDRL